MTHTHNGDVAPVPQHVSSFVGRTSVIAQVRREFETARLVTLTGAGGIGKTRLAREVLSASVSSQDFPDGATFVELAQVRDHDDVPEAVVRALGLSAATTLGPVMQLAQYMASRGMLLILDNCEHVLPGCRALTDVLLRSSAGLRVLATSREPLGIGGERAVSMRPLTVPNSPTDAADVTAARSFEAVALLEDRARGVNDQFVLNGANIAAVVDICIRLDGLPLAIELAAARLRVLSPGQLLDRIDDRFSMLTKGDPTALPHHRTLEALVQWSYELCSIHEQNLWNRIAIFYGGADLDAVTGICWTEDRQLDEFLDDLDGLVTKSIVIADHVGDQVRYRLLETIAAYGRRRLDNSADLDSLRVRHGTYFRRLASDAASGFYSEKQHHWMEVLGADLPNLTAAFGWLVRTRAEDGQAALELASSLRFYWASRNLRQGRRWLDTALELTDSPTAARGLALYSTAWVALLQGDPAAARTYLDEAYTLARHLESATLAAHVATWRGTLALFTGDLPAARASFEQANTDHRRRHDAEGLLITSFQLAITCALLDDSAAAHGACTELIALSNKRGETWARSYALWTLAHDAWRRSDLDTADDLAQQSLRLKYASDDDLGIALTLGVLAGVAASRQDYERAARLIGIAEATWISLGTGFSAFGPQLAESYSAVATRTRDRLGTKYDAAYGAGLRMSSEARQRFIFDAPAEAAAAKPGPQDLSRREREVALLLAQGLTNKQMAERLVLSIRTVEGHVERILSKLAFNTRTEAGVWAAAHLTP